MGSRRRQLILKAYLRGHLSKDLPFGRTSVLRNRMILDAMEAEDEALFLERHTMLSAILVSGADLPPESRKKVLKDLVLALERADILRNADHDGVAEHTFHNSSLAVETLHDLLRKAELVTGDTQQETE